MHINNALTQFHQFLEEFGKTHFLSGTLQLRYKEELIFHRNFGMADYENQIPFSDDSVFSYYSISKPFCAIGIMKQWDKGLVELDAHPGRYVPEAKALHPAVTIRHLLQHTSGIADFEQTEAFRTKYVHGPYENLREHLACISTYPTQFEPGTGGFYANINYCLISLILESVTGMDYGMYMREEVFSPLGLTTAQIDVFGLAVANRVRGYAEAQGKRIPVEKSYDWMRGAGDVIGTAADLYCLNPAIKHRTLLSDAAWKNILTPSPVNGFGFGCTVFPWHSRTCIRHNGGHKGFRTLHFQVAEDDLDLIWLSNFTGCDIRSALIEAVGSCFYENADTVNASMDKGYI